MQLIGTSIIESACILSIVICAAVLLAANPAHSNHITGHDPDKCGEYPPGAIKALTIKHPSAEVIAVGHSGGANAIGAIIGEHHGLIDTAILIDCPCDLKKWKWRRDGKVFPPERTAAPPRSQSPSCFFDKVRISTRVIAMTGDDETNTFPVLAINYIRALKKCWIDARFIPVAGAGHGFTSIAPAVLAELSAVVNNRQLRERDPFPEVYPNYCGAPPHTHPQGRQICPNPRLPRLPNPGCAAATFGPWQGHSESTTKTPPMGNACFVGPGHRITRTP